MEKFGLRLTGCRKCYFSIFGFSPFSQISNDYCQKSYNVFRGFYSVTNIFDLHIFEFKTATLLNFFQICTDMHFVSLIFLNERNITTSLLTIHLECTVVPYANLNSSSVNKPFLNYGLLNMLFFFFDLLFMFILIKLLSKNVWNNDHFLI